MSGSDSPESPISINPPRLTYAQMIEDLSSIPINELDILFEKFSDENLNEKSGNDLYERLEKFTLFKSNLELENQSLKSDFKLSDLNGEFEELDKRLGSLQNFIEISKKFFSIDKV